MHWSTEWIGLPYAEFGRGPSSYDCLGLFMAVQREVFGVYLPFGLVQLGDEENEAHAEFVSTWRRLGRDEPAQEGDAVLMRRGRGWHVGVAVDNHRMLHADCRASVIEPFRAGKWGSRLDGVYRHDAV